MIRNSYAADPLFFVARVQALAAVVGRRVVTAVLVSLARESVGTLEPSPTRTPQRLTWSSRQGCRAPREKIETNAERKGIRLRQGRIYQSVTPAHAPLARLYPGAEYTLRAELHANPEAFRRGLSSRPRHPGTAGLKAVSNFSAGRIKNTRFTCAPRVYPKTYKGIALVFPDCTTFRPRVA